MGTRSYRKYTGVVAANGTGEIDIQGCNGNRAVEWDIYQISTKCGAVQANCIVIVNVNGNFLCATPQGSLDTATGPPDLIVGATDVIEVQWLNGFPGDPIEVGIWYNENPANTSNVGNA